MEFEWDAVNLRHLLVDRPHGVTREIVQEVASREPVVTPNPPGPGRTGSHRLIGPDATGRFWTVILLDLAGDRWRPITGRPSTSTEINIRPEANNE